MGADLRQTVNFNSETARTNGVIANNPKIDKTLKEANVIHDLYEAFENAKSKLTENPEIPGIYSPASKSPEIQGAYNPVSSIA
ncbi:MAG: hypothetical protein WC527_07915 [Candidatus Margulisiibacteriota bacterium]